MNMEKTSGDQISSTISEALLKLKEEPKKEKVDLVDIVKKLSSKKFDKKK